MRIRKNARLVLGGSSASCSSSFLVCQLNRSPWDVDSFSPQGEWDDTFALNGSLVGDSILPSDSLPSGESMELSFEYVEKPPQPQPQPQAPTAAKRERDYEIQAPPELELELEEAITTPLCSRVDGKGWHCQRSAKRGHTLCDHHISQLQHSRNKTPKKSTTVEVPVPPLPPAPKRRGRPKKPTAAPPPATTPAGNYSNGHSNSNNPYEFYYYSGFGPSWSRRRGGSKTNGNVDTDSYQCDDSGGGGAGTPGSSSTMSEDEVDDNNNNDNNNNVDNYSSFNSKKKKDSNVVIETVVDEELDYIDDDDDDEDDDQFGGRRRVRKPIKARSLKSLM